MDRLAPEPRGRAVKHPGVMDTERFAPVASPLPEIGRPLPEAGPKRRSRAPRLVGYAGALTLHLLVFAALALRWQAAPERIAPPDEPITVFMARAASPPAPVRDVAPGPTKAESRQSWPKQPSQPPAHRVDASVVDPERVAAPTPARTSTPAPESSPAQPTAPPSLPAPHAPRVASSARDSWQGRLLAHLEKHRRYPGNARGQGIQGTAYVRFRMNRAGMVLSASVQRSSGSRILDKAALETLRRAQPLPPLPANMSDEVELAVPVEFYLSR